MKLGPVLHELRESYRAFRYPGYQPIHHPIVEKQLEEARARVKELRELRDKHNDGL